MAMGQAVLPSAVLDVAEVRRLGGRIEGRERARSVAHAAQLVDALALHRTYERAGMRLGSTAELALLLGCSENRAGALLSDAEVLERLGALAVMGTGVLTVEQSRVVVDVLGPLDDVDLAAGVWERLRLRLVADADRGLVLPPARLRELLQRWLLVADPKGAAERRKAAQQDSTDVQVWRRDDGLADLALRGMTGPNAQACLARIGAHAQPLGPYDERSAGQRALDAAVDLLTGRTGLPFDPSDDACGGCGCGLGAQVPCGAEVFVHVTLPAALGASDEPAELVGHGPLDPALLDDLLAAAPVLHRVWAHPDTGVPVGVDDRTWQPGRHDPEALRAALLDIGGGPPPDRQHPVHPDDHPPPKGDDPPRAADPPRDDPPDDTPPDFTDPGTATPPWPRVLSCPHLSDPGPYRPGRRLRRLLRARAPRCEWPGCGRRASHDTGRAGTPPCDLDHDLPWPYGPTCACNTGPLCRRHHRIKQLGWTKHRNADGSLRWTSPTGRSWTTPAPHPRPQQTRPIPPLTVDPRDHLTQYELDQLMTARDPDGAAEEKPLPDDDLTPR